MAKRKAKSVETEAPNESGAVDAAPSPSLSASVFVVKPYREAVHRGVWYRQGDRIEAGSAEEFDPPDAVTNEIPQEET